MEGNDGSGVVAIAHDLDGSEGLAFGIFLDVDLALTVDLGDQAVGKGVHAGNADSVETTRNLITVLVEFASGVKDGHDDLKGGTMLLGMHARGDASAIVLNPYGIVGEDRYLYLVTVTGHGLVDTVVDHLVDQMVETALAYVADVHRRPLPNRLKSFQNLDTASGILLFRFLHLFVFYHVPNKKFVCFSGFPIKQTNIRKILQIQGDSGRYPKVFFRVKQIPLDGLAKEVS